MAGRLRQSEHVNPPSRCGKTILVVEDEILVRLLASDALRDEGYNVLEASNATEAVDLFRSRVSIDLVLSGVRMPGEMEGLGLLTFVYNTYSEVPVIITSEHLVELPKAATRPTRFMPKPYLLKQLTDLIESALVDVT
jgi:DNA-binding NtrC family response regulator